MITPKIAVHLLAVFTLVASTAAAAAHSEAKPNPSTLPTSGGLTANPWLQTGIEALSSGLFNATIEVDYPAKTNIDNINLAHQGMGLAGWDFVSATSVQKEGTTSGVLLTYRRRAR